MAEVGAAELYAVTGLQHLPFNTHLPAGRRARHAAAAATPSTLLLLPDLLAYWLTGEVGRRAHQRLDHRARTTSGPREWALDAGSSGSACRRRSCRRCASPATVVGPLLPEVAASVGAAAGVRR